CPGPCPAPGRRRRAGCRDAVRTPRRDHPGLLRRRGCWPSRPPWSGRFHPGYVAVLLETLAGQAQTRIGARTVVLERDQRCELDHLSIAQVLTQGGDHLVGHG